MHLRGISSVTANCCGHLLLRCANFLRSSSVTIYFFDVKSFTFIDLGSVLYYLP